MAAKTEGGNGGELRVRVDALERDTGHIEQQVTTILGSMATKTDIREIFNKIDGLANQQMASGKPNWTAIGVAVSMLGLLGLFAYWPINTATGDLKTAVLALVDRTVSQKQYDADQAQVRGIAKQLRDDVNVSIQQQRYNADMGRVYAELSLLRDKVLTRAEFDVQHHDLQKTVLAVSDGLTRRIERLEALQLKAADR